MSLTFTKDTLRAAYNFLNETPPFDRWNLPDGEEIEFQVAKDRTLCGWHVIDGDKHIIVVSSAAVGHTMTLLRIIAHEMVHLHERRAARSASGHSKSFQRWAAQVCDAHGFDPRAF